MKRTCEVFTCHLDGPNEDLIQIGDEENAFFVVATCEEHHVELTKALGERVNHAGLGIYRPIHRTADRTSVAPEKDAK